LNSFYERIGWVIEKLFKERLPEYYETLAFHFKNGNSIDKAVHYLMRSGEKSLRRYSVDESHQSYQEAFAILTNKKNEAKEYGELLIKLIVDWAMVYYYRGDFNGLIGLFASQEDIAESLDDKSTLGMFHALLGLALYFRGMTKDSCRYLLKAYEIGRTLNDFRLAGYASAWLACACSDLGRSDEAIKYGSRAREYSERCIIGHRQKVVKSTANSAYRDTFEKVDNPDKIRQTDDSESLSRQPRNPEPLLSVKTDGVFILNEIQTKLVQGG